MGGPVPWFLVSEMAPTSHRSILMSICSMANWFSAFVVVLVFPAQKNVLGSYVYVPFVAIVLLGFFFVWRFVPETKGKSVDEVMEEMRSRLGLGEALLSKREAKV